MAEQVSMAQFEDFNLKERRHYVHSGPQGGSLGDGMVPQNEERVAPVSLHRSRAAHDTTGAEPGTSTSGHGQQAPTPGSSSGWASSYQLQCQGLDPLSAKKKTGKKILAVPGSSQAQGGPGISFFTGVARSTDPQTALYAGTTKMSHHVPGYTGHIPVQLDQAGKLEERPTRDLIVENYKPFGAGYTGKRTK